MAIGFPVKADYTTGDVLSAANMNDLSGTLNYLDPTAKGDLFPASSGTALTRLAVGANGTVLTADSAEATGMKWAAAGGSGGMTLLSTTSLTGATTTVSSISGAYKNLIIFVKDMYPSTNTELLMGINSDTTAANYVQTIIRGTGTTGSPFTDNTTAGVFITGHTVLNSSGDYFAYLTIPDYANTTTKKTVNAYATYTTNASAAGVSNTTCAYHGTVAAVTALNFKLPAGTWSGGTVLIYGEN